MKITLLGWIWNEVAQLGIDGYSELWPRAWPVLGSVSLSLYVLSWAFPNPNLFLQPGEVLIEEFKSDRVDGIWYPMRNSLIFTAWFTVT